MNEDSCDWSHTVTVAKSSCFRCKFGVRLSFLSVVAGLAAVVKSRPQTKDLSKMNVNGIGATGLSSLINVNSQQQGAGSPSSIPPAGNAAAPTNISQPGELMQKLEQLQQQNPTEFTQVVSQLADSLQKIADQSGNSQGIAAKLATAFKNVASTGDLSALQTALQPSGVAASTQGTSASAQSNGAHHGHHHHGGAGGIAAAFKTALDQINSALQSSSTSST